MQPRPGPKSQRTAQKANELEAAAQMLADSRKFVIGVFDEAQPGSIRDTGQAATAADDYTFMRSVAVYAPLL